MTQEELDKITKYSTQISNNWTIKDGGNTIKNSKHFYSCHCGYKTEIKNGHCCVIKHDCLKCKENKND